MSQRCRQQDNGEISLIMSERQRQQEENGNSDFEKQSSGQDDSKGASMFKYLHWKFLVLCGIAVLCVDPLFLYLPVINHDDKCLTLDRRLMITALGFRLFFDFIYVGNIILGYFNRRHGGTGLDPYDRQPWQIIKRYLRTYFTIDILAILPIPQVLVPFIFSKLTRSKFLGLRKILNLFVLLQYVPRVLRIYLSWTKHVKSSEFTRRVWIKAAFNIFLYILASHVLGGLWYFFSIQRETACWHLACENHIGCTQSSFKCGHNLGNYTFLDDACPVQIPNKTHVDFGIFLDAIQSGTVSSTNIPQKIMYCFWWGLRNLSSLGQNLQTSTYFWENCFAVFISIYGLLLFLYFIGNAQTYIQIATEKATNKAKKLEEIEREMGLIRIKVESWMARNRLPHKMKEPIISCIRQRLKENKDFDMDRLISHLSKDLVTEIKYHLCLPLLQRVVPNLENQDDQNLLERICESLKPKYYNEDIDILRVGEPITMMVFTTQGSVWCFKPSNDENGDSADHQSIDTFELYGEELLRWLNHSPSHKKMLPITATKTVRTHSKVETFALTANDLKHLVPRHTRAAEATKGFVQGVFRHLN